MDIREYRRRGSMKLNGKRAKLPFPTIAPLSANDNWTLRNPNDGLLNSYKDGGGKFDAALKFLEGSTVHGLKYWLGWEYPLWVRILWFPVFFICASWAGINIVQHFDTFFSEETRMSLGRESYRSPIVFPAVTICPNNVGLRSQMAGSKVILQLISTMFPHINDYSADYCYDPSMANTTLSKQMDQGFDYFRAENQLPSQSVPPMVETSDNNALYCRWLGDEVPCRDLFVNFMTELGLCFTFNPGFTFNNATMWPNPTILRTIPATGSETALEVLLRVRPEEYCVTVGNSIGYKLFVHRNEIFPLFMMSKGSLIGPGFNYEVKIEKQVFRRETQNLGKCVNKLTLELFPHAKEYLYDNCIHQCLTMAAAKECLCFPTYSPAVLFDDAINIIYNMTGIDVTVTNKTGSWLCLSSAKGSECMSKTWRRLEIGDFTEICPGCLPSCYDNKYQMEISSAYFPAPDKFQVLKSRLNLPTDFSKERFREEFVLLKLFLFGNSYSVQMEFKRMSTDELLSNVGGSLGLFMGASFMSLAELVQLCFIFISSLCCKFNNI